MKPNNELNGIISEVVYELRLAARSLTELQNEVKELGLPLPSGSYGRKELENILKQYYWEKEHPGQPLPEFIQPMLLRNVRDLEEEEVEKMWQNPDFYVEKKRDGVRCVGYLGAEGVNDFRTRTISVKTFAPESMSNALFWLDVDMSEYAGTVVDGEVISVKKNIDTSKFTKGGKGGVTNNVLQAALALISIENTRAAQEANGMPLRYVIFDVMKFKGKPVLKLPYEERRKLLGEVFAAWQLKVGDKVELNGTTNVEKKKFFEDYVSSGGEGVVFKHKSGPYEPGARSKTQYKSKKKLEVDAAVTGFTPAKAPALVDAGLIGGLVFSCKDIATGQWHVVASISNMPMDMRKRLSEQNSDGSLKGLKPEALDEVWEISGMEWNANALLSHAKMVRPRHLPGPDQKSKEECTYDRAAVLKQVEEAQSA